MLEHVQVRCSHLSPSQSTNFSGGVTPGVLSIRTNQQAGLPSVHQSWLSQINKKLFVGKSFLQIA